MSILDARGASIEAILQKKGARGGNMVSPTRTERSEGGGGLIPGRKEVHRSQVDALDDRET